MRGFGCVLKHFLLLKNSARESEQIELRSHTEIPLKARKMILDMNRCVSLFLCYAQLVPYLTRFNGSKSNQASHLISFLYRDLLIPPSAINSGVNAATVIKRAHMKSSRDPSHLDAVRNKNQEAV